MQYYLIHEINIKIKITLFRFAYCGLMIYKFKKATRNGADYNVEAYDEFIRGVAGYEYDSTL